MLMPLGMTIMTRAAGPERVGRVMAVLGSLCCSGLSPPHRAAG